MFPEFNIFIDFDLFLAHNEIVLLFFFLNLYSQFTVNLTFQLYFFAHNTRYGEIKLKPNQTKQNEMIYKKRKLIPVMDFIQLK